MKKLVECKRCLGSGLIWIPGSEGVDPEVDVCPECDGEGVVLR